MDYFSQNLLDIVRRQGAFIQMQQIALTQCSLSQNTDIYGICSGKYNTNNGTGKSISYVDHEVLWMLVIGFKNSGSTSFSGITSDIEVQLTFAKTGSNSDFYPDRVINVT